MIVNSSISNLKQNKTADEEEQPIIKTWKQFEQHVLSFHRENHKSFITEWRQKGTKGDYQKLKDEMKAIRAAYYRGAKNDIEKRVRGKHISTIGLYNAPAPVSFFTDEKFLKHSLARAKEITVETVEEELQQRREIREGNQPEKEKKPAKPKTQLEKLQARIDAGDLLAEKGLEFTLLRSAQRFEKEEIKMSYKGWWIGDCVVRAIVENEGLALTDEERESFDWTIGDLRKAEEYLAGLALRNPKDHAVLVPQITLTDFYIRNLLQKKISNAEIYNLVEEFMGATVTRETSKFTEDGDRWVSYFEMDNICKVRGLKTGRYSHRNKQPEHAYKFIFDKAASIHFWNNVKLGRFSCRPLSFRNLRGGSQLIFRAIGCLSSYSLDLELNELCWIAKVKSQHKTRKQEIIEGFLNELKQAGYLSNWKKRLKKIQDQREKQVWYRIIKAKRLPAK